MRKEANGESPEKVVREIRRKTRRRFSAEEKIRIVLEGLRGDEKHRYALPERGPNAESLLPLEQGVSRGREEAPGWRHEPRGDIERSDGAAERERAVEATRRRDRSLEPAAQKKP